MVQLNERVWRNNQQAVNTKSRVYHACVLSFLLYGSKAWTIYVSQEKRFNSFHLRCLRRILHIRWQYRVTNTKVLDLKGIPNMLALLSFRRVRWLGHIRRIELGGIPEGLYMVNWQKVFKKTQLCMSIMHELCIIAFH